MLIDSSKLAVLLASKQRELIIIVKGNITKETILPILKHRYEYAYYIVIEHMITKGFTLCFLHGAMSSYSQALA